LGIGDGVCLVSADVHKKIGFRRRKECGLVVIDFFAEKSKKNVRGYCRFKKRSYLCNENKVVMITIL
jgi:hypothetical protein